MLWAFHLSHHALISAFSYHSICYEFSIITQSLSSYYPAKITSSYDTISHILSHHPIMLWVLSHYTIYYKSTPIIPSQSWYESSPITPCDISLLETHHPYQAMIFLLSHQPCHDMSLLVSLSLPCYEPPPIAPHPMSLFLIHHPYQAASLLLSHHPYNATSLLQSRHLTMPCVFSYHTICYDPSAITASISWYELSSITPYALSFFLSLPVLIWVFSYYTIRIEPSPVLIWVVSYYTIRIEHSPVTSCLDMSRLLLHHTHWTFSCHSLSWYLSSPITPYALSLLLSLHILKR